MSFGCRRIVRFLWVRLLHCSWQVSFVLFGSVKSCKNHSFFAAIPRIVHRVFACFSGGFNRPVTLVCGSEECPSWALGHWASEKSTDLSLRITRGTRNTFVLAVTYHGFVAEHAWFTRNIWGQIGPVVGRERFRRWRYPSLP